MEECKERAKLSQVDAAEKEEFLSCFKAETNKKIDEAIQYIKLIENEFKLDSNFPRDENWEIEEKLELFPSFIKKIYRDFVSIIVPKKSADVNIENIFTEPAETTADNTKSPNLNENKSGLNDSNEKFTENTDTDEVDHTPSSDETVQKKQSKTEDDRNARRKVGFPGFNRAISHDPRFSAIKTDQQEDNNKTVRESLMKRRSSLNVKKDILSAFRNETISFSSYFPTVLSQLDTYMNEKDTEKIFAMFILAVKSDKITLQQREGKVGCVWFLSSTDTKII